MEMYFVNIVVTIILGVAGFFFVRYINLKDKKDEAFMSAINDLVVTNATLDTTMKSIICANDTFIRTMNEHTKIIFEIDTRVQVNENKLNNLQCAHEKNHR